MYNWEAKSVLCRLKGILDMKDQRNGKYIVSSMLRNQSNFLDFIISDYKIIILYINMNI